MESEWKTVRKFLKQLKRGLPFDLTPPLLEMHPKVGKLSYERNTCTFMIITLFTMETSRKQPRHPLVENRTQTHIHKY